MTHIALKDGTQIRCTVAGSGSDVVLVHGWKQSHRLFDQAIHRLSATHRVIAFDQRGTGSRASRRFPTTSICSVQIYAR